MPSRSRRNPKKLPLTRERIVEAALELAGRDGVDSFSMRKLGAELGREAMSLYHFFPSKQHLVDALVDHALSSVEIPPEDLQPLERLRRLMRAYRAMAHRYASLYSILGVHRLNTPTGVRFLEKILGIMRDITGEDESAARAFRALGYYLMGCALDETMGYSKGPSAAEPADDAFIARECPHLARSARFFKRAEWDKTFELGMEAMLSALER
jgi:AcrR family transcriptional regulator